MLEVSMIAALIAVICIPSLTFLGAQSEDRLMNAGHAIANSSASVPPMQGADENPPGNSFGAGDEGTEEPVIITSEPLFSDWMAGAEGECC